MRCRRRYQSIPLWSQAFEVMCSATNRNVEVRLGRPLWIIYFSGFSFHFEKFLTIWVSRVQLQRLQGLCASVQKEPYARHPEEVHTTETEPAEKNNHVPH